MKNLILLLIAFATLSLNQAYGQTPDLTGSWQGTLALPNGKGLRTIIVIAKDDNIYHSTFYSIDQGGRPLKTGPTKLQGSTVTIDLAAIGGEYEGKLAADNNSIAGTFTQGAALPLLLVRATRETAWEIPAPPAPPKLMAANADPSFEVATIKPNNSGANQMQSLTINGRNFSTRASSFDDLIAFAYNVQMKQIAGAPDWAGNDRYDVAGVPDVEGAPNAEQIRIMMRKMLADRFQLKFHHEKRELSAFVLSPGKTGVKLTPTQMNESLPGVGIGPGKGGVIMNLMNGTMDDLAGFLQLIVLDRPVVDQTGLTGKFDMHFVFTPDDSLFNGHPPKLPPLTEGVEAAPGFFDALLQNTGLKLEAKKTPVDVLVIDHVEKPSSN